MLQLDHVAKSFGPVPALHRTRLTVASRRVTVLIGPSGCGKSTILRLMIGLVTPDEGVVRFAGQAIGAGNVQALRRRMGYVIQDGGLFPHLTAAKNVTLMAEFLKWPRPRLRDRLHELAALTLRMMNIDRKRENSAIKIRLSGRAAIF